MPKFYVGSGSLQMVISKGDLLDAAIYGFLQTNKNDILDEYFYIDERGFRDYISADSKTNVIPTMQVVHAAGSEIIGEEDPLP